MSINILHVFTSFTPIPTWFWTHRSCAVPRAGTGAGPRPGDCQVLPALLPCALGKGKGACGALSSLRCQGGVELEQAEHKARAFPGENDGHNSRGNSE